MKNLLIFDFDGVVADSEVVANQVLAEIVTGLGVPTSLQDAYRDYMGNRFAEVMVLIETATGKPLAADFPATFQSRTFERFRAELVAVDGVRAFLDRCGPVAKCIASSSSPDRLALCLDLLDLKGAFEPHVFSAASVPRGKPHPDIFLHAAERMRTRAENCIVLEDSPTGVRAGIAAGMRVIGVLAASHIQDGHREELLKAGAHHVVASFAEAEAITRDLLDGDAVRQNQAN